MWLSNWVLLRLLENAAGSPRIDHSRLFMYNSIIRHPTKGAWQMIESPDERRMANNRGAWQIIESPDERVMTNNRVESRVFCGGLWG